MGIGIKDETLLPLLGVEIINKKLIKNKLI